MYAIIEIAGKQCKVAEAQGLYVSKLSHPVGALLSFDSVLLTDDGAGTVRVGTPLVEGVTVKAKVVAHVKGDKVIVFKKKRRNGYKVTKGHRQDYTQIVIESIVN